MKRFKKIQYQNQNSWKPNARVYPYQEKYSWKTIRIQYQNQESWELNQSTSRFKSKIEKYKCAWVSVGLFLVGFGQYKAVSKSRIKINIDNAMFQNQYSKSRMTFHESISIIIFNIRRLNVKINIKNENWLQKIQNQYSKSRISKHLLKNQFQEFSHIRSNFQNWSKFPKRIIN